MVRVSGAVDGSTAAASSIAGGFVLVEVGSLMAAWEACRSRPLGAGDFRTWLACREMKARRCLSPSGRAPSYTFAELAGLLGVSERRARASARRLAASGLIEWSDAAIAFPDRTGPCSPLEDTIGGGRGAVAIPRRMLRLLAAGARPAMIATALALLLRCLSRSRAGFRSRGRVKASWIARAFGVDARRVKQARRELIALGWLVPEESDQWALNRWGRAYRIDLGWEPAGPAVDRGLPPPAPSSGPRLPPPDSHSEPLREVKNQEPARGGPAGVESEGAGKSPAPAPRLADIRPEDLRDTARLLRLHEQAIELDLVGPSEADRLRFVAAAEHARAIGTRNPPGLFARLLKGRLWSHLTQDDEDAASRRLKAHLFGSPGDGGRAGPRPTLTFAAKAGPSKDALLVREVRTAMARAGHLGDPFPMVHARDPAWTRERWDAALAEWDRWARPVVGR